MKHYADHFSHSLTYEDHNWFIQNDAAENETLEWIDSDVPKSVFELGPHDWEDNISLHLPNTHVTADVTDEFQHPELFAQRINRSHSRPLKSEWEFWALLFISVVWIIALTALM